MVAISRNTTMHATVRRQLRPSQLLPGAELGYGREIRCCASNWAMQVLTGAVASLCPLGASFSRSGSPLEAVSGQWMSKMPGSGCKGMALSELGGMLLEALITMAAPRTVPGCR